MCLAVPGQIIRLTDITTASRSGLVNFGGVQREINLAFTPEAGAGDYVVVHAGIAIAQVDEAEAMQVIEDFEAMKSMTDGGTNEISG